MSGDYSIEQQKLLIESLLSSRDIFSRCQSIVLPTYFNKQFQKTVLYILDFAEKYKSLPTVEQIFAETEVKLTLIQEISKEHQQYFLDEIEGFCRHSALTQAILKGAEMLEKGEYGTIEKSIKEALLVGLHRDLGIDYFDNPRERLLALKDGNGKLSTGWTSLDQKLYGVNRGELLIFCGGPGAGKSVALQNLTVNMALQAFNCIYITLELSQSLCSMRMDCMISGVKSTEIYKKLDDVELLIGLTAKQSGKITIKKMPSGTSSREIQSYIKEYQIQKSVKPDIILVDYIDLMMPNNKKISPENLFIKDKFVTEELRELGQENDALIATASQLGRTSVDAQEFNHAMIAGGFSKINTADNLVGIFNSARARERGTIEFQLMKTRNSGGAEQKITMAYNIDSLRISDLDESKTYIPPHQSILNKIKRTSNQQPEEPQKENTPTDPIVRANNLTSLLNRVRKT